MQTVRVRGRDRIGDEFLLAIAGEHHSVAAEQRFGPRHAAPQQHAGKDRIALRGVKPLAHGRMNAVGADQGVRLDAQPGSAPATGRERYGDPIPGILESNQMTVGVNPLLSKPLFGRREQNALEAPAMDRNLRPGMSGGAAARLAPDFLAEPVEHRPFVAGIAGLPEFAAQIEKFELANRMRLQIDADAELLQFRNELIDVNLDALCLQEQGGRQTSDAAAGNHDLHGVSIPAFYISVRCVYLSARRVVL